jgi:large subunit ribosomal protein L13
LASKQEKVLEIKTKFIVIDGSDLIAGRLCSNVAKLLLQGNNVSIVNCDKIMMSGKRLSIVEEYKTFLKIGSIINPIHGPYHPRRPDTMISRMVRGMLPRDKPSGQAALKRLRTYVGTPKELRSFEKIQFDNAKLKRSNAYYTSMGELGRTIGWTE